MTWIKVIADAEATGEVKRVYGRVRDERGSVGNVLQAESLNPEALEKHLDLYMTLMFGKSPLSRRERELIGVIVSSQHRCDYCMVHHADALGRYVKEPGLVALVCGDYKKAPLNPRERVLADAAVKLTLDLGSWGKADLDALKDEGLNDDEILALVEITAYFNYVNRIAVALGVEPDDAAKEYKY